MFFPTSTRPPHAPSTSPRPDVIDRGFLPQARDDSRARSAFDGSGRFRARSTDIQAAESDRDRHRVAGRHADV